MASQLRKHEENGGRALEKYLLSRDGFLQAYGNEIRFSPEAAKNIRRIGLPVPEAGMTGDSCMTLAAFVDFYENTLINLQDWEARLYAHTDHPIWGDFGDEQVIAFEDLIRDALFGVTSRVSLLIGASVGRLGQSRFIPLQWRSQIRLTLDLRRIKYEALTFDDLTFLDLHALPASLIAKVSEGALALPWHSLETIFQDVKRVMRSTEDSFERERLENAVEMLRQHMPDLPVSPFGGVLPEQDIARPGGAFRRPGAPSKRQIILGIFEDRRQRDVIPGSLNTEADGIVDDYLRKYSTSPSPRMRTIKRKTVIKHLKALRLYDPKAKAFIKQDHRL